MNQRLITLLLLLLVGNQSIAQDKFLLISGKYLEVKDYTVNDDYIFYKKANDTRQRQRLMEKMDVFSIIKADGTEQVIFKDDSINGLSVEQARNYIRGEQAAMKFYHRQDHVAESALVGMASSVLIFYSLPVPMMNAVILGRFSPRKMQIPEGYDQPYSSTEEYKVGYQKKARNLKIQQSIKWGYIGLGVGLAGFIAYFTTGGD